MSRRRAVRGTQSPKLDRERAALVVVDVQEAFRKALPDFDDVAGSVAKLVQGAEAMGVPIVVTEQYPRGLGHTVPEVAERLPDGLRPVEKVCFSAVEAEGFDLNGRDQAMVCGIETHVCVNQTVLDLLDQDVEVHVVGDAVGSRTKENRELGLHKAEQAGGVLTSVETALFELLRGSDAKEFKEVQALVK
jgi:nicotinamidase-related amidase